MIEKILVTLDGSEQSEAVVPYAVALAQGLKASIVLLHVVDSAVEALMWDEGATIPDLDAIQRKYEEFARSYLGGWVTRLEALGVPVATVSEAGRAATVILQFAEANQPDLIALSTHGRSGLTRMVLGSVAWRIINGTESPVLVMHPREEPNELVATLTDILVPLDSSPLAEEVLPLAGTLAQALNLKMHLVMVVPSALELAVGTDLVVYPGHVLDAARTVAREYLQGVASKLESQGREVIWEVLAGDPGSAIVDYSTAMTNNLVIMSTHGRSGFRRWALGSVTDRVIRTSHDPVIVIRSTEGQD
jgi:nucleotide-binding universal stress UspA family protein